MICDKRVANAYQDIIEGLGVSISIDKSLIRRICGLKTNCSPISPKFVLRSNHPYAILAIYEKYKVTDLRILSRLYGTKFKQRSKPIHLHKRFEFIRLYIEKTTSLNLSYWLGGGTPLGPYEHGTLIYEMVQSLKPKELNKMFSGEDLDLFEKSIGPRLSLFKSGFPTIPGRLVSSLEGEGKRRVFAISNYVCQRLLLPVHDWAMKVLKSIPMDGTHDQLRPFFRLKGEAEYGAQPALGLSSLPTINIAQKMFVKPIFGSSKGGPDIAE